MNTDNNSILTDPTASNAEWIKECIEKLVLPQFLEKNKSYANGVDEWHNIRQMAARNFPEEYAETPWLAMARVCSIVKDKHEVALARSLTVPECEDRLKDCLVYDLFRLRLHMLHEATVQGAKTCSRPVVSNVHDLLIESFAEVAR